MAITKTTEIGKIEVVTQLRYCKVCNKETVSIRCCSSHTMVKEEPRKRLVDISDLLAKAMNNTKTGILPKIKGVKGLMSKEKVPECLPRESVKEVYHLCLVRIYLLGMI